MRRLGKWHWAAGVVIVAAVIVWQYWPHPRSDEQCRQLAMELAKLQATQEQQKIAYFYELKEHEVDDAEAWRYAAERIERELSELTQALDDCTHRQ